MLKHCTHFKVVTVCHLDLNTRDNSTVAELFVILHLSGSNSAISTKRSFYFATDMVGIEGNMGLCYVPIDASVLSKVVTPNSLTHFAANQQGVQNQAWRGWG